jgi:hypothetical protein
MNLKKVLVAFMCVTALASFFGPTLTKVDATATVVDFETYSWSPPVLLGTGSFSDSGYTFAFHDGDTNAIYADTTSGNGISFSDGAGTSTPTITITKNDSGDFAFTDFSYLNASPALGLQITAKLDGSTLYTINSCATGSSGTETMSTYSELFGRWMKSSLFIPDTSASGYQIYHFSISDHLICAPNLVAPTIALSAP